MLHRLVTLAALAISAGSCREAGETPPKIEQTAKEASRTVSIIAPLIDPSNLDKLMGERAANRSLRLLAFHLETARREGHEPAAVITAAQVRLAYAGTPRADAVEASLLRNLDILEKLGCLEPAGMAKLKTGNAPSVTRGPYAGDIASVDHIIPRSVCEELDEKLYNLEFMPTRLNSSKGNEVGVRQLQLAREWYELGLLSEEGLRAVETEK